MRRVLLKMTPKQNVRMPNEYIEWARFEKKPSREVKSEDIFDLFLSCREVKWLIFCIILVQWSICCRIFAALGRNTMKMAAGVFAR